MFLLPIDEFIEEVKAEISDYEELGEVYANRWESRFRSWIADSEKKKNVKTEKGQQQYVMKDENDLFMIADSYWLAVESGKEEEYWDKFE